MVGPTVINMNTDQLYNTFLKKSLNRSIPSGQSFTSMLLSSLSSKKKLRLELYIFRMFASNQAMFPGCI